MIEDESAKGMPDFPGDKHAVTQYDPKAELYAQECEALRALIELNKGWLEGWPRKGQILETKKGSFVAVNGDQEYEEQVWICNEDISRIEIMSTSTVLPLPCGGTIQMLMDWMLSGEWEAVMTIHDDGRVDIDLGKGIWVREPSLTLALCAAVRAKMMMEAKHD